MYRLLPFLALNNNKPYERILPKEGLRQRDPFFPFLFVLCTEGHINQLAKGLKVRKLQGIQFSDTCSMVNHLLFFDSSLFIYRVAEDQTLILMKILDSYSLATDQKLNLEKSGVTFGAKVQ